MVRAPVVVNVHALGGGQVLPAPFGVCVNMGVCVRLWRGVVTWGWTPEGRYVIKPGMLLVPLFMCL